MKKLYITLICLFALVIHVNGQLKYGPRVSLGSSSLGGGNVGIGLQVGLFLNAELKDRMGFQPEVLFSLQTGSSDGSYNDPTTGAKVNTVTKYTFTYINIPLYGYLPVSKHITFLAGPQIGIVNKGTSLLTGSSVQGSDTRETITDAKSKIGIAAGIDFNLSSPLRLGLRFSTTGGEPFSGKSSFIGATAAYYMDW